MSFRLSSLRALSNGRFIQTIQPIQTTCARLSRPSSQILQRFLHTVSSPRTLCTDRIYLTAPEGLRKDVPILIGLMNSFQQQVHSIGYFRPIIPLYTLGQDPHLALMRKEFQLKENIDELYVTDTENALYRWNNGKGDELIFDILNQFEKLRFRHDFMVIEGTHATIDDPTILNINHEIAQSLNAPIILSLDCYLQTQNSTQSQYEKVVKHVLNNTRSFPNTAGILLNRVCCSNKQSTHSTSDDAIEPSGEHKRHNVKQSKVLSLKQVQALFKKAFHHKNVPYLGMLPHDFSLNNLRLNELVHQLNTTTLYDKNVPLSEIVISDVAVVTTDLRSFLKIITERVEKYHHSVPKVQGQNEDACRILVITSGERVDILFGLLVASTCEPFKHIAGILLTDQRRIDKNTYQIFQTLQNDESSQYNVPVFALEDNSYQTATAINRMESTVLVNSHNKIERAKQLYDEFVNNEVLFTNIQAMMTEQKDTGKRPNQFVHYIMKKSKEYQNHLVLPEGGEDRVLLAAHEVLSKGLAHLTILGDEAAIRKREKELKIDLSRAKITHPLHSPHYEEYTAELFKLRSHKGLTMEQAKELTADLTYFATMMVHMGHADGMISGSCHTTAHTIRPAMQIIKTGPKTPLISSVFFMCLEEGVRIYSDCAVNTNPTVDELAVIATTTAETANIFGVDPVIAMLSYATGDSNNGPLIDKVREATSKAKALNPEIPIYGPIQYDAAVNLSIAKKKIKGKDGSAVGGHANILIFPDLNTGNNTYKAVQQTNNCLAIGPVLQGLKKPINDLSRGSTVKDIVTTIVVTSIQAEQAKQQQQPSKKHE